MNEQIKIKVVTYNLQCDSPEGFAPRLEIAMKRFHEEKPDIIGFQEARPGQQKMLVDALPEYQIVGFGRDRNFGGESNCVAFRRDTFTLFGFHQCWLSPTPFVPGTRFPHQSDCPRIVCTVMLKHKYLDLPFRYYNTHLDHIDNEARVLGMNQVLDRIKADNADWNLPFILTGDMNAQPEEEPIKNALAFADYPMVDATAALDDIGTFHGYFRLKKNIKIDYIFASEAFTGGQPYLWDDCVNGQSISDHYPVACDLTIGN